VELQIKDKVAFVTGASKGIGAATAKLLADEGADVIVGYHVDETGAQSVARHIESVGRNAWLCAFDNAKSSSVLEAIQVLSGFVNQIDILILNAGFNVITPFEEVTFDEWDRVVAVNLNGTFYVLKSVLPFLAMGASVVMVSSVAAHTGVPHHPHYAAAKAGIENLVKSAARALSPNIRVNGVSPGITMTEMGNASTSAQGGDYQRTKLLAQRYATAEEIARSIIFLASPASAFIYGAVLDINGGRNLR
jgi:3-oxoacyl-[acyl-carrier protein] reductase